MPLPPPIYRSLDFAINTGDCIEDSVSQITWKSPITFRKGLLEGKSVRYKMCRTAKTWHHKLGSVVQSPIAANPGLIQD